MIYKKKKKYRKLMIEQHQPYYKPEVNSVTLVTNLLINDGWKENQIVIKKKSVVISDVLIPYRSTKSWWRP